MLHCCNSTACHCQNLQAELSSHRSHYAVIEFTRKAGLPFNRQAAASIGGCNGENAATMPTIGQADPAMKVTGNAALGL